MVVAVKNFLSPYKCLQDKLRLKLNIDVSKEAVQKDSPGAS
jgi:hypothetical protein